ncbi:MAG: UvrD-helicase domain-containing protein [Ruminococcus sp.]|uniref:UvrD-helicase domain-containing protein n=1 Tax=Ruminococcus sp. TaxID=41978 RepID=UPI0025CE0332|nr:UvrD-helicase domain-containing protein [Ruminococcus sp.]MCR5541148.1 UvrD-helicase domain-containing protein [Ruminococcus sp.]
MALMKDKQPETYEGEKKVWQCIKDNLPEDIVCYYNREVKGREFDFCLLIKDIGFVIIEVKGWNKSHIQKVVSPDEIIMTNGTTEDSPKKQARSYSFKLKNIMNDKYGINPLVMNMVCYPFISEAEYNKIGLSVVSEPEYTLFSEDIESNYTFSRKILGVYQDSQQISFDKMVGDKYDVARHHFEPSYIVTPPAQDVIPYSCLSVFSDGMTLTNINDIIISYFKGTKQIVFTKGGSDLEVIAKQLSETFTKNHIMIKEGNLAINSSDETETIIKIKNNRLSVFNFEVVYISENITISSFQAYNGKLSEEQEMILSSIAAVTNFNINQFHIEHAETGRDIQVKAGAGTGKTYSMVSRIAYLCSHASNSGVFNPAEEIAMLTFTADAALNMKSRLKQLFVNYFILTNNTQYLEMVTSIEKMRISTIHSFAKEIISNTAITLGIGTDFTTIIGKYDKQKIFDRLFTAYLEEENKRNPIFFNGLPMGIEDFRKLMLDVANKLYEKGCDIKTLDMSFWGDAPVEMPYLNKIIEQVVVETEKEYSKLLIDNNAVALSEYMIHLSKCIDNEAFNTNLYEFKYVFIDEFQDTDDAQIASFIAMQKKLGFNFFIVGDLKQSIYRFRGATMTAFEKMGCDNGNWLSFTLNINYRSDKRLLNKFDRTFSYMNSINLLKYERETDTLRGIKTNNISEDLLVVPITYHNSDKTNSTEYYDMLFKAIEEQRERINADMKNKQLSKNERTIAILTRSNYQINEILKEAKNRDVIIESDNNIDLYRLAPSTDLCRLTSALCNPYNPTYLYDLIHSRNVNVLFDIRSLIGKTEDEKTAIFIDCLDKFFTSAMGKTWKELIRDIQNEPVLKTLRLIYEATKPWKAYAPSDEYMQEYYRANYELVFEELSKMNKKSYLTLDYINGSLHISIMTGTEAKSREIDIDTEDIRVICLTVHKSKGLEYGTVIMPATDQEIDKPHKNGLEVSYIDGEIGYCLSANGTQYSNSFYESKTEIKEMMMEESRILYVAMTRAIDNFICFIDLDAKGNNWGEMLKEMFEEM